MNKGIGIRTTDIYLRFPEIMEEECNDLAEFLEDEHIVYQGATDIVYNLQKELEQLKEIEKEHQRINGELRVENKELQDKIDKALDKIQLLIDIGFDYDGFNQVNSLKGLIDELVSYARDSRAILKGDKK